MALNLSSQNIQQRVNLALKLGWFISQPYIDKGSDSKFLCAPKHFKCNDYAATWKEFILKQGKILIPHYFEDDYVMTTGEWNEQEFFNTDLLQTPYYRIHPKNKKSLM